MLQAKIKQIICKIFILLQLSTNAQVLKVGAERTNLFLNLIKDKKIAVVGNHTSMINNTHLVDSLLNLDIEIIKVFSPEHGFRGDADAGEKINNEIDYKTGLPIISLYGNNKKPLPNQIKEIDIIIFDIQDVGVRFYTYLSTLHYVMEAAAENNIQIILLDRPNPNGHYIDGPVLKEEFESFVGKHPVPIVYGMTIGEYASMINGEEWITKKCDLKIIKMENYDRNNKYNLPLPPSPNLPNLNSINLYPSLCLFEGTEISVGRGTMYPFQHFGSPNLKSKYSFTPSSRKGSKYPKHEGRECFGINLKLNTNYLKELNLNWLIDSYEQTPKKENFFNNFFDKLAGNDLLRLQIISGMKQDEIKKSWEKDLNKFKKKRAKYLIY